MKHLTIGVPNGEGNNISRIAGSLSPLAYRNRYNKPSLELQGVRGQTKTQL